MKISEWLFTAMAKLGDAGVDSPRRDALVLLEDTLEKDRSWVLAHPEYEIQNDALEAVNKLIQRRINREPLAYIRKKAWFYGRFFYVNESVLVPRPESEAFIDLVKKCRPKSVLEIGTGSGCIAITLALELENTSITATDTSTTALDVARKNIAKHRVKISLKENYLLDGLLLDSAPEALVANLPYVPDGLITSPEIEVEPKEALFAGESGMDLYESLWGQVFSAPYKPRYIFTESLESQHSHMSMLAAQSSYSVAKSEGLIQKFVLAG